MVVFGLPEWTSRITYGVLPVSSVTWKWTRLEKFVPQSLNRREPFFGISTKTTFQQVGGAGPHLCLGTPVARGTLFYPGSPN